MKHPLKTLKGVNLWLSNHGNGIGVSWFHGCFTVFCQTGTLIGGARTLFGSGATIEEAIEHAELRITELKVRYKTTPQKLARKLEKDMEERYKTEREGLWGVEPDGGVDAACPGGIPK